MTSMKLMSYCEHKGVVHIDGTYKLIKNNFPVVVIGKTDIQGKFFPRNGRNQSLDCLNMFIRGGWIQKVRGATGRSSIILDLTTIQQK